MNDRVGQKGNHDHYSSISSNIIQENCIEFENACNSIGTKRIYQKNSIITEIGENVAGIYFLNKGLSVSTIIGENGMEKVVFINKAPCFFNEGPFIGQLGTEMEIRALTDCKVTIIDYNNLERLLFANKLYNDLFMRYLARKACAIISQMTDILTLNPTKRIYKILIYLAQEGVINNKEIIIHSSQEELARICGLHRVSVARAFKKFKSIGLITKISKSTIVLASDYESIPID